MKNKKNRTRFIVCGVFICLAAFAALTRQAVSEKTAAAVDVLPYEPEHYGLIYLYSHSDWGADKRDEMAAALADARSKGVTTIVQTFSNSFVGTPQAVNWLIFLDEAAAAGIDVIAYLWPRTTYPVVDGPFYYDDLKGFLDVAGDHPALIGYIGLHEPLEPQMGISADELRGFYTEMKSYAPDLLLAHFMGNMAYVEEHRTDGWMFSDDMCDICLIWYYPFETIGGVDVYQAETVTAVIQSNHELAAERDADAQLWFLGQSFAAPGDYPRQLRMPTAAEMEALYLRVMEYPINGFLWYPWNQTEVYDQVLSDPGLEEQQTMVEDIGTTYVRLTRVYFPVVQNEYDN